MAEPTSTASPQSLVWIGDHSHPEVALHWERFRLTTTVHWRKSIAEFLAAPPNSYSHLIVIRLDRTPLNEELLTRLTTRQPTARHAILEGSLCAGLGRVEKPIAAWQRLSTSCSTEQLFHWYSPVTVSNAFEPGGTNRTSTELNECIGLIGYPRRSTDWLAAWFEINGVPCVQVTAAAWHGLKGIQRWVWDESAISHLGFAHWRVALQSSQPPHSRPPCHIVLTSLPHWHEKRTLIACGVAAVLPKPLSALHLGLFSPAA